jgi:hypothetical protein
MKIIPYTLLDNTVDKFILINPTKPQIAFFTKEESSMLGEKSYNNLSPAKNDTEAPSDYIGSAAFTVPATIDAAFVDFKYIKDSILTDFFTTAELKLQKIDNRIHFLRIPAGKFQTTLTATADIAANGGSKIRKDFGTYYITIEPKCIVTNVIAVNQPNHTITGVANTNKKRTVIDIDKTDFLGTIWDFESVNTQKGRLIGSVVEIWDATLTRLKQTKVITENDFGFTDTNVNGKLVLTPDSLGYDVDNQAPLIGDMLKVYPRESYFDSMIVQLDFKNILYEADTFVSYMLNDTVRDIQTGVYEIYDKAGFTIDASGNFNGNVIQKYQIFQKDIYEARKRLK